MTRFVGRRRELVLLEGMLDEVRKQIGAARPGKCVIVRGPRRIGKSALVEEFLEQQRVPSVFYTAEIGFGGEPLREFSEAVRLSGLREAQVFGEAVPGNWSAALRQLAGVLPARGSEVIHRQVIRAEPEPVQDCRVDRRVTEQVTFAGGAGDAGGDSSGVE